MKRFILLFFFLAGISAVALAQNDSLKNSFQQEFDEFKQAIQEDHQQFINKNDSIFAKFLQDSWEEFEVMYKSKPAEVKPKVQPEVKNSSDSSSIEIKIEERKQSKDEQGDSGSELRKNQAPKFDSSGKATLPIDYYGESIEMNNPGKIDGLQTINAANISSYFENTSVSPNISKLVIELNTLKEKYKLNDWGYFKLVEEISRSVENKTTDQKLLAWILLMKSGYNVKIGYSSEDIYLMIPFKQEIYSIYYLTIENNLYYIVPFGTDEKEASRMMVHKANYPGSDPMSLKITELPKIGDYKIDESSLPGKGKFSVLCNHDIQKFYDDYPLCDLSVYFSAPMSEINLKELDEYFDPVFKDVSDVKRLEILLKFIQENFSYQSDKDQFGREKYMFPEELFYYPYSDCEDRAVLFTKLVEHFTNFDCIGLDFPGHVNTAVHIPGFEGGTFVNIDGQKYTVCDPTYKNAPIGYLDKEYAKFKPLIIQVN